MLNRGKMFGAVSMLAASAVSAGALSLVSAGTASASAVPDLPAAQCGGTMNPATGTANAHWDVTCSKNEGKDLVTISGFVHHKGGAGCAYVVANFQGTKTEKSGESCGFFGGKTVQFHWTEPGTIADAYLTET